MNNKNKNEIHIPVGNAGFYSEFLVESQGTKAYKEIILSQQDLLFRD